MKTFKSFTLGQVQTKNVFGGLGKDLFEQIHLSKNSKEQLVDWVFVELDDIDWDEDKNKKQDHKWSEDRWSIFGRKDKKDFSKRGKDS